MLIRYSSQDPSQARPFTTREKFYYAAIYPDEKEGAIWAVGTRGDFYKVNRYGKTIAYFKADSIAMADQVAFNTEKNYAWVINVNYDDANKTKLQKLSMEDGTIITEVKPEEYVSPGEHHGRFTVHLSLDRQTESLWIFDAGNNKLMKLSPEGKLVLTIML